jgi:hypothetical protein
MAAARSLRADSTDSSSPGGCRRVGIRVDAAASLGVPDQVG